MLAEDIYLCCLYSYIITPPFLWAKCHCSVYIQLERQNW